MKTSEQWWNDVKVDPKKLIAWLKDQYHGEVTAVDRIEQYIIPGLNVNDQRVVRVIAEQESQHAEWVAQLLLNRGVEPEILEKDSRYWDAVFSDNANDPLYASGVAAHAEAMRLERIQVIANDWTAPDDIRFTFGRILIDERFHARAFRAIAGEQYYNKTAEAHAKGLEALGLIV